MAIDPEDGLVVAEVGDWAEEKYLHVEYYAQMFAKAMKGKWDCRVYLELFSGPGRANLQGTASILDSAPLRALALDPGFDLYVYGELDGERLRALEARCHRAHPAARCAFIQGDVNATWPELLRSVQENARGGTYLTFCFVDPYACSDLAFSTLRGLADLYIDFLVLIPSFMDANRNCERYLEPGNEILDRFLGDRDWKHSWLSRAEPKERFGLFVADQFGARMQRLGFLYDGLADMKLIRSTDKNLPPLPSRILQSARAGDETLARGDEVLQPAEEALLMSATTSIEWTDATWNPVRGCTKVSPGCKNCYALRFAERFRGVPGHPFEWGFDLRLVPEKLEEPLRWKAPRRIFVNSMSDLFHERIPVELHPQGLRRDGPRAPASVPGPHEALRAAGELAASCRGMQRLDGRQRREPALRGPRT
jgi:three-Cys-motif partner protein